MQTKDSKVIAIKQAAAFSIDLILVSLPLIVAPSLESFPIFAFLWFVYIPFSEFYFSQTIGMKIVGTHIFHSFKEKSHIKLGTALRRQIARVSIMWGAIGWLFLFLGRQYVNDYVIVDKNHYSIEPSEDGWIETHKNNEYKVIFFVIVLMFIASAIIK
ncbi:MAG: RDD family protein [Sulfurimonas sp.]|jgi:uncharacterized RDD family membrane protein YckC|nr:RDD family protein [Sulfurimonas sp.]